MEKEPVLMSSLSRAATAFAPRYCRKQLAYIACCSTMTTQVDKYLETHGKI